MNLIQAIIALCASIKILDKWIGQLTIEFMKYKKEQNDKDYHEAMAKAVAGNTADLQRVLGSELSDDE